MAADEFRKRKEYWRFGFATGSLVASFILVTVIGPYLAAIVSKVGNQGLSSLFGGII